MSEFKTYHPIVNLIYFILSIGFTMFFQNPVCIAISLVCAIIYSYITGGTRALRFNFITCVPIILISGAINTAFNHAGVTVIAHFPNGNPITAESIIYGLIVGGMIGAVICWFSCYNKIMTEDKFIYLFGRISPSLALVISMALRFIPQFIEQARRITDAQRQIGKDIKKGKLKDRIKTASEIMSVMATWSLEKSVITSDSMRARGYGTKKRTTFSIYRFSVRDTIALIYMLAMGTYIVVGILNGAVYFQCIPYIKFSTAGLDIYAVYFMLLIFPVIIEVKEGLRWKSLRRKI